MSHDDTTRAPAETPPSYSHRASYSPQDDRLRLFLGFRLPKAEWDVLKAAGWVWTMKQASDLVAPWTPEREDQARELAGEIDDEDEPREDRSADRAERFTGYMDKREDEAEGLADRYDGAPRVHAAQDEGRASRSAARHDRIGARAASKWETAEYWSARTAGVIRHALYLELPAVRHRRIKGIEAEIRGLEERTATAAKWRGYWLKVAAYADPAKQDAGALTLANHGGDLAEYAHPTNPEKRPTSLYSLLRPYDASEAPITGAQAAALYLAKHPDGGVTGYVARWTNHYKLRLAYEVAMLEAAGGTLANVVEIVAGGFVGSHQIAKVSKDRAGRVSKVYFLAPTTSSFDHYGKPWSDDNPRPLVLHDIAAERLTPGSYRAPTEDEAAEFKAAQKRRAGGKPKAPPLLNPDDASAQRIQDAFNARVAARFAESHGANARFYTAPPVSEVCPMTQAEYSARSAGTYSPAEAVEVRADGSIRRNYWSDGERARDAASPVLCRLRVMARGNDSGAFRVVILTDKPRAAVPEFTAQASAAAVAS